MNRLRLNGIGMTSQRTRERMIQRLRDQGIGDAAVLEAMRTVPRHLFVDEALASRVYEDTALPIGFGQTLSQPYVVARMTEVLLGGGIPERVLEVGTGSGYQTAVLAALVPQVYTVERIADLLREARSRFHTLGLRNVHALHTDGSGGWSRFAPYDGILVTAAAEELPEALLEQLAVGGRLVAPVGGEGAQELLCITRTPERFERVRLERVSFVPLLGGQV